MNADLFKESEYGAAGSLRGSKRLKLFKSHLPTAQPAPALKGKAAQSGK